MIKLSQNVKDSNPHPSPIRNAITPFVSERRKIKLEAVAASRQQSLHLVLENIHDPHNVSAILRSCDAVGIPLVSLLYTIEKFPRIGKKSSASAFKWVARRSFRSAADCARALKEQGFALYASALVPDAKSLYELDFTKPCAVIMGNEHRGVSPEMLQMTDAALYIPMQGMVQSLNVSVAAAVILYEAMRQRAAAGMYPHASLSEFNLHSETR